MAYYFNFTSPAVTSASSLSLSSWVGAANANWSVEIDLVVTSLAATCRVGGNTSGTARGINVSTAGALLVAGVAGFTSATGLITAGTRYTIKLESVGTTKSLFLKLASDASYGSAVASVTDNNAYTFNVFGRTSSTATLVFNFYRITLTGGTYNESWTGDTASGTGVIWSGVNGNNLTLLNPSSNTGTWWVFYSSGASNTVSVSATLPKITGSLTLNEINPSYVISVNGQLPKLTGAVALNEINPVFTVAVAGQLPKLTGSIALNQFANNRQVTVNGVLPKLTGAVTLNRMQPNNQVAVSGQLPRITASITLRVPDSYPTANPNDYTVSAYLSTDSTYTARLSESSTINAIISASSTFNARLN